MKDISDVLTVSFDNSTKDESALCVSRKCGEKTTVLKMELGVQADILYQLLTEQMTKVTSYNSCHAYKTLRDIRRNNDEQNSI